MNEQWHMLDHRQTLCAVCIHVHVHVHVGTQVQYMYVGSMHGQDRQLTCKTGTVVCAVQQGQARQCSDVV